MLIIVIPIKLIIFFALFLRSNLRARNAFLAALALTSYSEFALITAQVGVSGGLLPVSYMSALGLTVALSFVLAAPFNRFGHGLYERLETRLSRYETAKRHPDQQPMSLGSATVLICGMGRTGSAAYEWLRTRGKTVAGFDSDPAKLEICRASGYRALYGDAEDVQLWADLRLDDLELSSTDHARSGGEAALPWLSAPTRLRRYGGGNQLFPGGRGGAAVKPASNLLFNPFTEAGARLARLSLQTLTGADALPEAES